MSTFAIVLDGVIRKGADDLNVQGAHLYNGLSSQGRVAIFCGEDEDRADWFLRTHGLVQHAYLIPERSEFASTHVGRRMAQISQLRAQGSLLEFVVEPDPEIATEIFRRGIPVLPYLHPKYTQPSFRPDYRSTATPWESLTEEVNYQIALRAKNAYDHQEVL